MEQTRNSRSKLLIYSQLIFNKVIKNLYSGESLVSSINGVGKTGYPVLKNN